MFRGYSKQFTGHAHPNNLLILLNDYLSRTNPLTLTFTPLFPHHYPLTFLICLSGWSGPLNNGSSHGLIIIYDDESSSGSFPNFKFLSKLDTLSTRRFSQKMRSHFWVWCDWCRYLSLFAKHQNFRWKTSVPTPLVLYTGSKTKSNFKLVIRGYLFFVVHFPKYFLQNSTMAFCSRILPVCFSGYGSNAHIMFLGKFTKLFRIQFGGCIKTQKTRCSCPRNPALHQCFDSHLGRPWWWYHCSLERSAMTHEMVEMKTLAFLIGPSYPVHRNSVSKVFRFMYGTRSWNRWFWCFQTRCTS